MKFELVDPKVSGGLIIICCKANSLIDAANIFAKTNKGSFVVFDENNKSFSVLLK